MGQVCCKSVPEEFKTRAAPPPPPPPKDSRSCTGVVYSSICGDEIEQRGRPSGPYKQAETMNRNDGGITLWKQSDVQAMQGNAYGYGNAAAYNAQAYASQAQQSAQANYAAASTLAGDYYNQGKGRVAGYQQQARDYQNQNQNSGGGFFDGLFGGQEPQPQMQNYQNQARGYWNAGSTLAQDRARQGQQQAQGFWNAGSTLAQDRARQGQQQAQGFWNAGNVLAQDKYNQAQQQGKQGGWFS